MSSIMAFPDSTSLYLILIDSTSLYQPNLNWFDLIWPDLNWLDSISLWFNLGGHSEENQRAAYLYGTYVGQAFQLIDDALDFEGTFMGSTYTQIIHIWEINLLFIIRKSLQLALSVSMSMCDYEL